MWQFIYKHEDRLVLTFIILISIIVWWPSRNLPYFWDSSGFVIQAARDLGATHFSPWIARHSNFAHPPVFISLLALAWNIGGQNLLVSHILMWGFYPLLLWSTYMLAKKMQILMPALAVVLVGMLPYVLAEYMNIYVDLPTGALAVSGVAAAAYGRHWWMIILLTLAVLSKETALLVLPGVAILLLPWRTLYTNWRLALTYAPWKNIFPLTIPVMALLLYLLYHHQVTGWYLIEPGREMRNLSFDLVFSSIRFVLAKLLFEQNRTILTLLGVAGFAYIAYRKLWFILGNTYLGASLVIVLLGSVFFGWTGEFALRYAIFLTPFYILVLLHLFSSALNETSLKYKDWIFGGSLLIPVYLMSQAIYPTVPRLEMEMMYSPPDDMRVLDLIMIGKQAASVLETTYPDAQIFGAFPENLALTQPYQGYVSSPLTFAECGKIDELYISEKVNLIYFHLYSPIQTYCGMQLLAREHSLIRRFEQNGKWIGIYKLGETLPEPQKQIAF